MSNLFRTRWAAIGAAVAVALGAGGGFGLARATISSGERTVLVPIESCRLTDTRTTIVDPRAGPLQPGETYVLNAHGSNGECTGIPTDAVALLLNVTALDATAPTFFTIWGDGDRPNASSLNPVPGQPATPNAVTTDLTASGEFRIFNAFGAVGVIVDVLGYYVDHNHDDRYYTQDEVDAQIAGIPGAGTSYTKAESDARFYEGTNVVLVASGGTAAENGTALRNAIDGITDASSTNPYVVRVPAGIFDIGTDNSLQMKDFVSVQGAGRYSTVIRSGGLPFGFNDDQGTVRMATGMSLADLTVRNDGGLDTDARSVLGTGDGWLIHNVRLEVTVNQADFAAGFSGPNVTGSPDTSGVIDDVEIEIFEGSGPAGFRAAAIGSVSFFGDLEALTVLDSSVVMHTTGIGIGDLAVQSSSDNLVVRDTTVELLDGGTGAGQSTFDEQIYDNVYVSVSGGSGTNIGFSNAGSGFRPQIIDSTVIVEGAGARGISTNTGFVVIRNSLIRASSIGVRANNVASVFTGTYRVENSTIDAPTAFELENGGVSANHVVRVGNSQIDATTNVSILGGNTDVKCANTHDEDFVDVMADCT